MLGHLTLRSLLNMVEKDVSNMTQSVIKQSMENELRNSLQRNVYGRAGIVGADRTYDMLNNIGTSVSKEKYFVMADTTHMMALSTNTHPSWDLQSGYADTRPYLIHWLNEGHMGLYEYPPTYYFDEAKRNTYESLAMWLRFEFLKLGVKMKKGI